MVHRAIWSAVLRGGRLGIDNLTHTLVGVAIARTGVARMTPLATTTLVIAANAPDIDVLAFARGPYFALAVRRGITHGWPALVLLALVVTAVVLTWDRRVRRERRPDAAPARAGPVLLLATIGVASHPALDWLNTYGVRWAMPLSPEWSYGDTLFIIDPWIWLVLGGVLLLTSERSRSRDFPWSLLALLTTALILLAPTAAAVKLVWVTGVVSIGLAGAWARWHPPARLAARIALVAVAAYVGAGAAANRAARGEVLREAGTLGLEVIDVMVGPLPGAPLSSEVEVRTPNGYVPGTHRWWSTPRVRLLPERTVPARSLPDGMASAVGDEIIRAAFRAPEVADYLTWSRYPIIRVEDRGNGWRVRVGDARYDARPEAGTLGGVETLVRPEDLRGGG